MATTRQTSFRAGEWAPSMWGRTDLEGYAHALRRARNFFVSPQGTAVSRPGTHVVAECKTSASKVRLIPFVYSDSDSMVLEFGDKYIRFHRAGQPLKKAGVVYELPTTYNAAGLGSLRFIQVGSVLFLVHPLHPPQELVRQDETEWTLAPMEFNRPSAHYGWVSDTTGGLVLPVVLNPRENPNYAAVPDSDASHPTNRWTYKVTVVRRTSKNVLQESRPYTIYLQGWWSWGNTPYDLHPAPSQLAIYPDFRPTRLWIPVPEVEGVEALRVYRGRSGSFGLVGEVPVGGDRDTAPSSVYSPAGAAGPFGGMYFEDPGYPPNYSRAPPVGRKPFITGNYPQAIGMYEQRMLFADFLLDAPGRIEASAANDFTNFDRPLEDQRAVQVATATVSLDLASRKAEEVRALVGLDRLLVFTQSSVWSVEGADGRPLSPTDLIAARVQSEIGAARLDPIVVGNRALWVRAKGQGVRDLVYDWSQRSYVSSDLSVAAAHLLREKIIDWTYAEDPFGIVWLVRQDGTLLSMTYGEGGAAWAWHDTPGGLVESVCSVPEGDEDAVYLVVKRGTRRIVERMASRRTSDVREAMRLDCGRTQIDAVATGQESVIVTGLAHLNGREVWAVCDGRVVGPLTVAGGQVTVQVPPQRSGAPPIAKQVITHVGLRFDAELELLDVPVAREKNKKVAKVLWEVEGASGLFTGQDFEHLMEWRQKTVAAGYGPNELVTGEAEVVLSSTWNRHGRAVLRQVAPLPITVLGVTREGEIGS